MECLLCYFKADISKLKDHYLNYHFIDPDDGNFLNSFKPDFLENNKCAECQLTFSNKRKKKNHMFLKHYRQQVGGSRNNNVNAPLNILKRGTITYYSVNFVQHKNFYNFYVSDIVIDFLNSVYQTFKPNRNIWYKFQGYFELVNQLKTADNQNFITDNRSWLTNVYNFKHFNEFVRAEIFNDITKRIIYNGLTGSSWHFKRFERLSITVVPTEFKVIKS